MWEFCVFSESAYRIPESAARVPKIPVQPIGYAEAEQLLRMMTGDTAPPDWQGGLNPQYRLGPGFQNDRDELHMRVFTTNQEVYTYNVVGTLYGSEEKGKDRYVVMGNHRDAWILGALDPSSGTAALMEIARAFATFKSRGIRPRRSVVFCSWGAEEYGLVGSTEWVEEHAGVLSQRTVVYLNVDMSLDGNDTLRAMGVPLMYSSLYDAARRVGNPNPNEIAEGRKTVFDTWLHYYKSDEDPNLPQVWGIGGGSDYKTFVHYLGIPSIDIRYTSNSSVGGYPLYHTLYETYHLVTGLMDEGARFMRATAQMWAEMARNFADAAFLPLDARDYAAFLDRRFRVIETSYGENFTQHDLNLGMYD
ncbi:unnamed protein product, partial [Darwinula stevensoni]